MLKTSFLLLFLHLPLLVIADVFSDIPGKRHDIGGYQLHLYCLGNGSPTVIIDAGLGDDSSDWLSIVKQSAKTSKICVYDRPGYGWSDSNMMPRTSARIANELDLLLKKAEIPPPYILVGHSFGGFNIRLFAAKQPDNINGMILIDASHEDQYQRLNIALPPASTSKKNIFVKTKLEHMDANDPKHYTLRDRAFRAASNEIATLSTSAWQVKQSTALPNIPLIVISRGKAEWSGKNAIEREKIWLSLQQSLSQLSNQSQHLFANKSGHNIPKEQPDIVIDAISSLIQHTRTISSP